MLLTRVPRLLLLLPLLGATPSAARVLQFEPVNGPYRAFAAQLAVAASGDSIDHDPYSVRGWLDGWITEPGPRIGRVFGRNMPLDLSLALVRRDDGLRIPLTVLPGSTADTLRVSVDFGGRTSDLYDLEFSRTGEEPRAVPGIVFLGAPPVFRVPEEYPTIAAALVAAPPGTEIRVGPGEYAETLTIDKPVRLIGADRSPRTRLVSPVPSGRILHVLPEAGSLFEVHDFLIRGGVAEDGPGGGIWLEAPGLVQDCAIDDCGASGPGARGGGICALSGARIRGSSLSTNVVELAGAQETRGPWSTDPTTAGAGGNLFCLECLVEDCWFGHGTAVWGSSFVVDGVFRGNVANIGAYNYYEEPIAAVLRGEILDCGFESSCISTHALLVDGPTRFERNNVCHVGGDLCESESYFMFRGSIVARENAFHSMVGDVCLDTDPADEPDGGRFVMENNAAWRWETVIRLHPQLYGTRCGLAGSTDPRVPIALESVQVRCNRVQKPVFFWEFGGQYSPCDTCEYRIDDGIPAECPDSTAAEAFECQWITPVLVLDRGLEARDAGVRLWWRVSDDATLRGFEVWRWTVGGAEDAPILLTPEPLTACHECEFIDTAPPRTAEAVHYRLDVLSTDGARESYDLGEWTPSPLPRRWAWLDPAPHPIRSGGVLRFALPRDEAEVSVEVIDLQGRHVTDSRLGPYAGGRHEVSWTVVAGKHPPAAGVYVFRLSGSGWSVSRKFLVLP